nr:2-hydroxyacyl-CoA dehydratase [Desulfobacula sp.]
MTHNSDTSHHRQRKLMEKIRREIRSELDEARLHLQQRADYHPVWDYFLNLLTRPMGPDIQGRPVVKHLCNLAPYELFHALGLHPVRLGSGCFCAGRLSSSRSPGTHVPLLKSTMGALQLEEPPAPGPLALGDSLHLRLGGQIPGVDQWAAGCPFYGTAASAPGGKGQQRWLEEIYGLVRFLENQTGRKLKQKTLSASVQTLMRAWQAFGRLIELRRKRVLAGVWFTAAANSFMLDAVEMWTEQVHMVVDTLGTQPPPPARNGVFLAGSPIIFPNFKLLYLIEAAGMDVYGDDLCTSERIWPGALCYDDPSLHGILRALAGRYHNACICPTFADNERRINSILNTLQLHRIQRVVFHVLKGCHPFDIEGFNLESRLKSRGYNFLKIETDYVQEDSRNILTRLEAFGRI